jgi:hypothetical protein
VVRATIRTYRNDDISGPREATFWFVASGKEAIGGSGHRCPLFSSEISQLGATPESGEPLPIVSHLSVGSHLVQEERVAGDD